MAADAGGEKMIQGTKIDYIPLDYLINSTTKSAKTIGEELVCWPNTVRVRALKIGNTRFSRSFKPKAISEKVRDKATFSYLSWVKSKLAKHGINGMIARYSVVIVPPEYRL